MYLFYSEYRVYASALRVMHLECERQGGDSMKWIKIIAGITTCKSPVNHWITVEYTSASKKK